MASSWLTKVGFWRKRRPADRAPGADRAPIWRPSVMQGQASRHTAQLPRFQATAADRLDPRMSDQQAAMRMRLRGAFTPSLPVTDPALFAGRAEVLGTLIRAIEDQRLHVVLYGERGIGKTSLLHVLTELAREARYLVIYISCGAGSTFDEMVRQVADDIPLLYHADYGPTTAGAEAGASFGSLLPAGTTVSVRVAAELFAKIAGTRVLVVLDEFDRAESSEFRRAIAELMKTLSDRVVRAQLVIAGVAADLTELVERVPSIQRNIFAQKLPKMDPTEVRLLLKRGGELGGLSFAPDAEAAVVSLANGIPYLASLISYLACSEAVDAGRTTVTDAHVAAAVSYALTELKGRISKKSQAKIAECMQKGSHVMLGRLAGCAQASAGQFTQADIAALYPGLEEGARCRALVRSFAQQGMLIEDAPEEDGVYRFSEESVLPYLWLLAAQSGPHRSDRASQSELLGS